MAAVKLRHQKQLTLSGIQRLEKSFILDRNAMIQKIQARIREERSNLLQSRRELRANDEDVESTNACRSAKQHFYKLFNQKTNVENLVAFEEEVADDDIDLYEEWLVAEVERAIEEEEEEGGLVCPVCCRHLLQLGSGSISCPGCSVSYANRIPIEEVRQNIKSILGEHNVFCTHSPLFSYVADSKHAASMLLMCNSCSYLNVAL